MQPLSPERVRTFNGRAPVRELTLAAAQAAILAAARRLPQPAIARAADLAAARGRVLAADVLADRDAPPFRRSMRDGYAVRAADGGVARQVIGEVHAGQTFVGELPPGAAVAIMTGAPVPAGADAVVMVEHTRSGGDHVELLHAPPATGDNIAPVGSDTPAGGILARAGRRVDAGVIAVLAGAGCLRPHIYRRPRVAVISTGDELVAAESAPEGAQIRDSNGPMLAAQAVACGAELVRLERLPDDSEAIAAAVQAALGAADVVVTSGGASVGAHDALGAVLAWLDAELVFDAVRQRPGRPVRCAVSQGRLLLALPGNPAGALLGFLLYARPALEVIAGMSEPAPHILHAPLRAAWQRAQPLPLTQLLPVRLRDGAADILPYHGSADLAALAAADGYLMLPENTTALPAGAVVEVLLP